jgi:inner membrane protein
VDSLTHLVLGACIGEGLLGRPLGKRALLWGGVAQSLPDVDVLAALWLPPAENLLVHRGITHSLVAAGVAALGLAWVATRRGSAVGFRTWALFFALQFVVHDLLDTCNAYGTGLLEPFSGRRFSFHLLYVADPLFTLPLLVAALLLWRVKTGHSLRKRAAALGLLWAAVYLGGAAFAKARTDSALAHSLTARGIPHTDRFSTPTPFNSLLWYAVAGTEGGYLVGYRSVFEPPSHPTAFTFFPRADSLLPAAGDTGDVSRLIRFADGFYTVERHNDTTRFNVLRFGQVLGWQHPGAPFAFQYLLGGDYDNTLAVQRGRFRGWNATTVRRLRARIFSPPIAARSPGQSRGKTAPYGKTE